jgi:hypothetical protein
MMVLIDQEVERSVVRAQLKWASKRRAANEGEQQRQSGYQET